MRLWYLSQRQRAKAQVSLRIRSVSPEPSLFEHMKKGPTKNQTSSPTARLKNEFTEDGTCHNLTSWLNFPVKETESEERKLIIYWVYILFINSFEIMMSVFAGATKKGV